MEKVLQEIDPDFDLKETIQKKLHTAINDHCVLGHYLFSFKKCSNDHCPIPHICREKFLEDEMFTRLHHLPSQCRKKLMRNSDTSVNYSGTSNSGHHLGLVISGR